MVKISPRLLYSQVTDPPHHRCSNEKEVPCVPGPGQMFCRRDQTLVLAWNWATTLWSSSPYYNRYTDCDTQHHLLKTDGGRKWRKLWSAFCNCTESNAWTRNFLSLLKLYLNILLAVWRFFLCCHQSCLQQTQLEQTENGERRNTNWRYITVAPSHVGTLKYGKWQAVNKLNTIFSEDFERDLTSPKTLVFKNQIHESSNIRNVW